jgi:hypothetical protein
MKYKNVERIITVEFIESGAGYDVRVTPEEVVVRCGDSVVWDVQGLSKARAVKIAFGNFEPIALAPSVVFGKKGFSPAKPRRIPGADLEVKETPKGFRAKLDLGPASPGFYKYDIRSDQRTLVDPDMEIRGPR